MVGEIKHYDDSEKPWGLFVNNEFIGSFATLQEAAKKYEQMAERSGDRYE